MCEQTVSVQGGKLSDAIAALGGDLDNGVKVILERHPFLRGGASRDLLDSQIIPIPVSTARILGLS